VYENYGPLNRRAANGGSTSRSRARGASWWCSRRSGRSRSRTARRRSARGICARSSTTRCVAGGAAGGTALRGSGRAASNRRSKRRCATRWCAGPRGAHAGRLLGLSHRPRGGRSDGTGPLPARHRVRWRDLPQCGDGARSRPAARGGAARGSGVATDCTGRLVDGLLAGSAARAREVRPTTVASTSASCAVGRGRERRSGWCGSAARARGVARLGAVVKDVMAGALAQDLAAGKLVADGEVVRLS
jgi:hypothetical protein